MNQTAEESNLRILHALLFQGWASMWELGLRTDLHISTVNQHVKLLCISGDIVREYFCRYVFFSIPALQGNDRDRLRFADKVVYQRRVRTIANRPSIISPLLLRNEPNPVSFHDCTVIKRTTIVDIRRQFQDGVSVGTLAEDYEYSDEDIEECIRL